MTAQATAKSVMASAKRLIDVRQSCFSSSRMAEMRVPAWPMPIHQTRLMMSKPQPTGTLMPHTPTPLKSRVAIVKSSSCSSAKATPKPTNQPSGVRRLSARLAILSVTVPSVWPGAMIASISLCSRRGAGASATGQLRVGVLDRAEVGRARAGVEVFQHAVVARQRLQLRDGAPRVVDVAEHDRLRGAGLGAGGRDLAVLDRALLVLGLDLHPLDALHAVRALLHDAPAAHGDVGVAEQLEARRLPVLV